MRRVVITGVLLAAALAPGQSIASTHAPQRNWALMLVTAGRHGASDVRLSGDANGVQPGAQPLVVGVLFADQRPHHPRIVVSLMVQNGGGPDQVRTAGPLGHQQLTLRQGSAGAVSFGSSGQFGNFAPGETLAELFLFAGGSLTRTHLDAVASSGSLTVNRVYGTGATALYVADDQDAGLALDADVASAGSSSHGLTTTTGLAGSLIDFDDSQAAAVDTASWTAPDRSSGSIDNLMTPTSGCGVGEPAFAGGPGHWTWSWKGASQEQGELGIAAWAPIGSYWHRFRTPAGGTGVCLPPVFVPVAHSSRS